MTRPETALAQLATVAQTAIQTATPDGRGVAVYPAIGNVAVYPTLLLFWGETGIDYATSEQVWSVTAKGQLLTSLRGKLAADIARADPLIAPLVDAFAPGTAGFMLRTESGTGRLADYCRIERVIPSLIIEFPSGSGTFYYGCELYWRLKLRRFSGET